MKFFVSSVLVGLISAWTCTAILAETGIPNGLEVRAAVPTACETFFSTASCATVTTTVKPTDCPPVTDLVCPLYVRVTSVEVPCGVECCPTTTPTVTTTYCKSTCIVPTETITVTTGCPKLL